MATIKILFMPESTEGIEATQVTAMKTSSTGEPLENEEGNE